ASCRKLHHALHPTELCNYWASSGTFGLSLLPRPAHSPERHLDRARDLSPALPHIPPSLEIPQIHNARSAPDVDTFGPRSSHTGPDALAKPLALLLRGP